MMSIESIRQLSNEAAKRARDLRLQPRVFFDKADAETRFGSIPNIGSASPKGWRLVEHKLVDKSGMGAEDEPALTVAGFQRWIIAHLADDKTAGFAIIEEGQFQFVIGRFAKVKSRTK